MTTLTNEQISTSEDLGLLQRELESASSAVVEAQSVESRSRNSTTNARNRLNAVQKQIDAVTARLKKAALSESDWARTR